MLSTYVRRIPAALPSMARFSSTTASSSSAELHYTMKPPPSKAHLHKPIPSAHLPQGYVLTGIHSGIKKVPSLLDLAVIKSTTPEPASAAACFTRNAFRAAPVVVSEEVLRKSGGKARSVVVSSGNANAVTGAKGLSDAWAMVKAVDSLEGGGKSGKGESETLVMSTGVIGVQLPIDRILSGISSLAPSSTQPSSSSSETSLGTTPIHWERVARAFMTTDTFPKLRARTFTVQGRTYRIAGMSKGAGMIHPDMGPPSSSSVTNASSSSSPALHATLLALVLTDAPVSSSSLQSALTYATDRSFNAISVDGDMSTNDTVLALANGAAAAPGEEISETRDVKAFTEFRDALTDFAAELAQLVVRDGEGATKFVTVSVEGAKTYDDARAVASRISTSALVKTALYGEDANWGRILAATGSLHRILSSPLDPTRVSVSFIPSDGSVPLSLLVNGEPQPLDEVRAKAILVNEELEIRVDLGLGSEKAKYWSCDFSYEYVKINGDYRS